MQHEDFHRDAEVERSSERSFGLVFGVFFLTVALWPLLRGESPRFWAICISFVFVAAAFFAQRLLAVPNRWWTKFGILLGNITAPIALAVLFFGVFTPLGMLMRFLGKDSLRLRRDPTAVSYWIKREPPGPVPGSMVNQF